MSYGYQPKLCDGPPCPSCGCQDVRILQQPTAGKSWWGSGKAKCRHCGRVFFFREVANPVPISRSREEFSHVSAENYFPGNNFDAGGSPEEEKQPEIKVVAVAKCPDCGETMKISSTRKDFRYHKCPKCGKTTKTAR